MATFLFRLYEIGRSLVEDELNLANNKEVPGFIQAIYREDNNFLFVIIGTNNLNNDVDDIFIEYIFFYIYIYITFRKKNNSKFRVKYILQNG